MSKLQELVKKADTLKPLVLLAALESIALLYYLADFPLGRIVFVYQKY